MRGSGAEADRHPERAEQPPRLGVGLPTGLAKIEREVHSEAHAPLPDKILRELATRGKRGIDQPERGESIRVPAHGVEEKAVVGAVDRGLDQDGANDREIVHRGEELVGKCGVARDDAE